MRQVTLGAIHARLLPSAAVTVDGFKLSNPNDFAAGQFLSADQIRGGLTLMALLRGDIHVTSLKLVRPKLVLTQDELGHANYTFPPQSGAREFRKLGGRPRKVPADFSKMQLTRSSFGGRGCKGPCNKFSRTERNRS